MIAFICCSATSGFVLNVSISRRACPNSTRLCHPAGRVFAMQWWSRRGAHVSHIRVVVPLPPRTACGGGHSHCPDGRFDAGAIVDGATPDGPVSPVVAGV